MSITEQLQDSGNWEGLRERLGTILVQATEAGVDEAYLAQIGAAI
jgi:hypothetical protein